VDKLKAIGTGSSRHDNVVVVIHGRQLESLLRQFKADFKSTKSAAEEKEEECTAT